MKKNTKRLLVGAGVLTAGVSAAAAVSYNLTKLLMNIAMDREIPKFMYKGKEKLTGAPDTAEVIEQMDAAKERLLSSDYETVEIESADGLKLIGHWKPCADPKRVIVAMHGWRSTWAEGFGSISEFLEESGCAVLYAEQRAQGESEGECMTFGLLERYDCLAWVNFVNEKTDGRLPVYLYGISMGATTVLMTAGLELPDNVRGVIADCGFTSPNAIWKYVAANNIHVPFHSALAKQITKRKSNVDFIDCSTTDAMQSCKVPVLFIHGEDDRFVPLDMTFENYQACASEKRLLIVPEAGHGLSYITNPSAYEEALTEFWQSCDK